jgi:putative NIF3 family GTP cyclohydrolase 1 type 2
MKIRDVVSYLSTIAPPAYQESYDNAGLITGDPGWEVRGALVTLDCTEPVVDEAIEAGANLIVAHHPILFRGIKRLTGGNYVERTLIKAIKNDIAIFAMHTNLDNVLGGVNSKIAEKIGLVKTRILQPKKDTLSKLVTFIPRENAEEVLAALHGRRGTDWELQELQLPGRWPGSLYAGGRRQPAYWRKGEAGTRG